MKVKQSNSNRIFLKKSIICLLKNIDNCKISVKIKCYLCIGILSFALEYFHETCFLVFSVVRT